MNKNNTPITQGRMKAALTALIALALALFSAGCAKQAPAPEKPTEGAAAPKKVVCVTTPFIEDMVLQVAGDSVDTRLVIPAGEDPHLYLPKPEDLDKLKNNDLLLYHGLHFEGKMIDILEQRGQAVARNFASSDLTDLEEDGSKVIDPHFWFDLRLYEQAVEEVAAELIKLLPENKDLYTQSKDQYIEELKKLDEENRALLEQIPEERRYLITPHDAFNYFSKSYNIQVHAPQGVSTETEVGARDISETVDFIVTHQVKAIFSESTTDPARMRKLQEEVKARGFEVKVVEGEGQELFSDSLAPRGQAGDTFIDMYRHNVKLISDNLR